MKKVYLTHCSAKKVRALEGNPKNFHPIDLYTATPTQRFMKKCENSGVNWAIFSDKYGVWRPDETHEWYEKDPDKVSHEEFELLLKNFDKALGEFDEIWFYYNPGRFHPLYEKLINSSSLKNRIRRITHLEDIRK